MRVSSYDLFNGPISVDLNITGKDTILISGDLIPSPYDFTISMTVAIKEFSHYNIVLLGPGN